MKENSKEIFYLSFFLLRRRSFHFSIPVCRNTVRAGARTRTRANRRMHAHTNSLTGTRKHSLAAEPYNGGTYWQLRPLMTPHPLLSILLSCTEISEAQAPMHALTTKKIGPCRLRHTTSCDTCISAGGEQCQNRLLFDWQLRAMYREIWLGQVSGQSHSWSNK